MLLAAEAWDDVEVAKSELVKLHRKMGHTDFSMLVQQLKVAFPDRDLSKLQEAAPILPCDSCEKRKRAPNRPMVALPKERHFNYEVGVDIWHLRSCLVLHVICMSSV